MEDVICLTEAQLFVLDSFDRLNRYRPNELEMIRYAVGGPSVTDAIVIKFVDWMPMHIDADGYVSY